MNPSNHASLEASKRLIEVGIVLETDAYWVEFKEDGIYRLVYWPSDDIIPAPSMAEVWRELPDTVVLVAVPGICTTFWLEKDLKPITDTFQSNNPTDALVDLLIWIRKEK